jgi:hypothetical protein
MVCCSESATQRWVPSRLWARGQGQHGEKERQEQTAANRLYGAYPWQIQNSWAQVYEFYQMCAVAKAPLSREPHLPVEIELLNSLQQAHRQLLLHAAIQEGRQGIRLAGYLQVLWRGGKAWPALQLSALCGAAIRLQLHPAVCQQRVDLCSQAAHSLVRPCGLRPLGRCWASKNKYGRQHPPSHARRARAVQQKLLRSATFSCFQIRHSRAPGRSSSPVACSCRESAAAAFGLPEVRERCAMMIAASVPQHSPRAVSCQVSKMKIRICQGVQQAAGVGTG